MKLLFNADVFGWNMTGLIGKDARWFFGYSRNKHVKADQYPDYCDCRGIIGSLGLHHKCTCGKRL